jgi:5'-methylthioadenosine phosphorylase
MKIKPTLAVIGGSGLYDMPGLEDTQEIEVTTPFGKPSSPIVIGNLEGQRVAFLARHGIGHFIMPTEVNYQANIYALKELGVERVVSVSAVGSLREDYEPGQIVVPDNIYDNTKNRKYTFFGNGIVVHVSVADPYCPDLSRQVEDAVRDTGTTLHMGGSLIVVEGPRFSTKAESNTYRSWGMSLIGMTASPEAFLAREAELCYTTLAHVTDYDVWHVSKEPVTVEMVIEVINKNIEASQNAIRNLARNFSNQRTCGCDKALSGALITKEKLIPPETKEKVSLLIQKYIS